MPTSLQIRSVAAALLFASALYSLYWTYSHGGFYSRAIHIPIQIAEDRAAITKFSVAEAGDHYVMVTYPAEVASALDYVAGEATLNSGGKLLGRARSPFDRRHATDFDAIVLFTLPMKAYKQYILSLHITYLPRPVRAAQAIVQVELDHHYMFTVWQVELVGVLMALAAILCGLPVIRGTSNNEKK